MAHSDVVPADRSQWSVPPFSAELRQGFIYGRGAQDDKSLLAAELAVMVELKRRGVKLTRDVILLSESDEEAGSTGINWLVRNAYPKIDAAFALNEGGAALDIRSGTRIFQIQTSEKVPTRVVLTAKGTAGHASLPRPDNPVVHLARAIAALAAAAQPVQLNTTTRRYFSDLSKLPDYAWLAPLLGKLEQDSTAIAAANQIESMDPGVELDAPDFRHSHHAQCRYQGKCDSKPGHCAGGCAPFTERNPAGDRDAISQHHQRSCDYDFA